MKSGVNQIQHLHILLNKTDMLENKAALISLFTNGRTESSRAMQEDEIKSLCRHLSSLIPQQALPGSNEDKKDRTRKRIISKFMEMGYTKKGKSDITRIKEKVKEHWHKEFNDFDLKELTRIASVLEEKWLPHYYKKIQDASN
jgi:hypothetical protein